MAQSYWLEQRAIRLHNDCFTAEGIDERRLSLFLRYQTTYNRAFQAWPLHDHSLVARQVRQDQPARPENVLPAVTATRRKARRAPWRLAFPNALANSPEWSLPLAMDVHYKVLGRKKVIRTGFGKTIDMCSGGLLISTESTLVERDRVELAIDWPAQLDGVLRRDLVVFGRVVRVEHQQAAIIIDSYEFRTRGDGEFH